MNQITRNAPFGTDNTPAINVKIIGGKRVEQIATSNIDSQELSDNNQKKSPKHGPHGTPSMLTQPLFREYEYADFKRDNKQTSVRNVTSYTSPNGDRTRSFRHGLPTLNKHPIIPPIGISQPAGNYMSHQNEFNIDDAKDDLNTFSNSVSDANIEYLVSRQMKGFSSDKIKDMYIELTGFDRHLTGYVTDTQLNLVALRFNLPIKLSLLKIITPNFADPTETNLIDYESFLQFLSTCTNSSIKTPKLTKIKSADVKNTSVMEYSTPTKKELSPQLSDYPLTSKTSNQETSTPLDEKLVSLIREQLSGEDEVNVSAIKGSLATHDRLGNGELPAEVIQRVCVEHRLPLTKSVITKMLQRSEIANGIVNWKDFIRPLAMWDDSTFGMDQSLNSTRESPRRKETSTSIQSRPTQVTPEQRAVVKPESRDMFGSRNTEPPTRTDMWMRNFNKLALALKSYHPYKTDLLPHTEVRRMAANYNLIYGLGFSENQLAKAVDKALMSRKNTENGEAVSINRLLENLMGITTS